MFDLSVDRASEVPLSTQLIWKLRTLIATGELPPGTRLPGIREVADAANVNVNTVRAVFARLEEQGLLTSEQGRGTFVAAGARPDASLSAAAGAAIAHAVSAGLDPRDLAAALYVSARDSGNIPPPMAREEADRDRLRSPGPDARAQRRAL